MDYRVTLMDSNLILTQGYGQDKLKEIGLENVKIKHELEINPQTGLIDEKPQFILEQANEATFEVEGHKVRYFIQNNRIDFRFNVDKEILLIMVNGIIEKVKEFIDENIFGRIAIECKVEFSLDKLKSLFDEELFIRGNISADKLDYTVNGVKYNYVKVISTNGKIASKSFEINTLNKSDVSSFLKDKEEIIGELKK